MICDRYLASSVAYGEAQGLDAEWLPRIQEHLPQPSLTLLLDIPPEASLARKQLARDRYERDLALLARVRESYLRQAARPGWQRIDGARDKDAVTRSRRQRPWRRDSGCCKRADLARAAARNTLRARLQRRARRRDVVDEHDHFVAARSPARPETRGDARTRPPRWSAARPPAARPAAACAARGEARSRRGHAEAAREVRGLIEAALVLPARGAAEPEPRGRRPRAAGAATRGHQSREPWRHRAAAVVLQRVHDLAQRAVVGADRRGPRRARATAATPPD